MDNASGKALDKNHDFFLNIIIKCHDQFTFFFLVKISDCVYFRIVNAFFLFRNCTLMIIFDPKFFEIFSYVKYRRKKIFKNISIV